LNAGIVHQDIRATEPFSHRFIQPPEILYAAYIRLHRHDARGTIWRYFGDGLCRSGELVFAKIGNADPKAETREANRCGQANTRAASGDDGDRIFGKAGKYHGCVLFR
jgi:hypothetical protein